MASSEPVASYQLAFEGNEQGLDALHRVLGQVWEALAGDDRAAVDGRWRALWDSALAEVAANIIEHALGPGLPSTIELRVEVLPEELRACFRDRGRASGGPLPGEATLPHDLDQESGRGLAIAAMAVDRLRYERVDGENRWELSKRF